MRRIIPRIAGIGSAGFLFAASFVLCGFGLIVSYVPPGDPPSQFAFAVGTFALAAIAIWRVATRHRRA